MGLFEASLRRFEEPRIAGLTVIRELARGGHSAVYLARRADGHPVAIKRWTDPALRESGGARLAREIEALRSLRSPHIIGILDAPRDADGQPCLVMEYAEGGSLAERLIQRGPLQAEELPGLLGPLFEALGALAAAGLVHRDIKPANVVLRGPEARPVLVDFSIVKRLQTEDETRLTATAGAAGTAPYMAPEQCEGGPGEVDARTDLYGLGALTFHALTGLPPWRAESAWERRARNPWSDPWPLDAERRDQVRAVLERQPVALQRWLIRSLEGAPEARFQSAAEMREALRQALLPASYGPALALIATLLLLSILGVGWALSTRPAPPRRSPARVTEPEVVYQDKFCRGCGRALEGALAFCPSCGKARK